MKSKSFFANISNLDCVFKDKDGNIISGVKIIPGSELNQNCDVIMRFDENGMLHSDDMPAVETQGHVEYWQHGKLHRENNLPAVSANNFSDKEFWVDGKFIKK